MGKQVKKHGYSCKLQRVVDGDTCDVLEIDDEDGYIGNICLCVFYNGFNC